MLTGILGFTELSLLQVAPGTPAHQYITETHGAAQQGTKLINEISQFSKRRIVTGRSASVALIASEQEARMRKHGRPGIDLRFSVATNLPKVALDLDSLKLVVGHLLDNAVESITGAGSIDVSAELRELSADDSLSILGNTVPGPYVELCIADTGSGFTPEARKKVLSEPFFSTKPRRRGMGLPAVYGSLFIHGGGLRFEHPSQQGTIARVYLPLAAPEVSTPPARREAAAAHESGNVLVVDDDPLTLQLMCTTLERAGYQVQPAGDGMQALDSFAKAKQPFQLLLSDVAMPRMTGFDLAQQLLDRDPHIHVLFTSGHIPAGYMPPNLLKRNFELLPKPFRPEGLLQAVRAALQQGTSGVPAAQSTTDEGKRL
jgi:CheY-like chemotaxis protein